VTLARRRDLDPATTGQITGHGYAFLDGRDLRTHLHRAGGLEALAHSWSDLPLDDYAVASQAQRYRRFGRVLLPAGGAPLRPCPPRPFVQAARYNALHGGQPRLFAPLRPDVAASPALTAIIAHDFALLPIDDQDRHRDWEIGVHQVSIRPQPARPGNATPEGIHRDGHRFIAMHLIERQAVQGGTSLIYGADRRLCAVHTLTEPLSGLLVDDRTMFHAVSPIERRDDRRPGHRHMLLLDYNLADGEAPI
jgi:hypothetical protein